jgi:branched-subunit amino acid ABC-type transport system permease component
MIELGHDQAYLLQQALNALQLSAFYLPLSVAFAMIQAITRRIFLSFGDLAMFASFAAIYLISLPEQLASALPFYAGQRLALPCPG